MEESKEPLNQVNSDLSDKKDQELGLSNEKNEMNSEFSDRKNQELNQYTHSDSLSDDVNLDNPLNATEIVISTDVGKNAEVSMTAWSEQLWVRMAIFYKTLKFCPLFCKFLLFEVHYCGVHDNVFF